MKRAHWVWIVAGGVLAITVGYYEGRKYLLDLEVQRLCAIDGGIKVFETVYLTEEEYQQLLNRYGELTVPNKQSAKPSDPFFLDSDTVYLKKGNPEMWRSEYRLMRREDAKVLATSVFYARRGGDVPAPWHDSSFGCPDSRFEPNITDLAIKKSVKKEAR